MKKPLITLLLVCQSVLSQNVIYEEHLNWLGDDQRVADYIEQEMPEDITIYIVDGPVYKRHLAFVEVLPKNTYIIVFSNDMTILEYLKTYLHEMVHINQFHSGRAKRSGNNMLWQGKKYSNLIRYSKRPWEIEADSIARVFIK